LPKDVESLKFKLKSNNERRNLLEEKGEGKEEGQKLLSNNGCLLLPEEIDGLILSEIYFLYDMEH